MVVAPRKHSELIKKWADGAEIEYLDGDSEWVSAFSPCWDAFTTYREKPQQEPLVERECKIVLSHSAGVFLYAAAPDEANCVFVFRGDKLVTSFVKQPTK